MSDKIVLPELPYGEGTKGQSDNILFNKEAVK